MRRTAGLAAIAIVAAVLFVATPPKDALAGSVNWAWAVARHPTTASYHPAAADHRGNPAGQVTITRASAGTYTVKFNGVGTSNGMPFVTALGTSPRVCNVENWLQQGAKEVVRVNCWNYGGTRKDSQFVVNFIRSCCATAEMAYLWASDPTSPTYTPFASYSYNSTGGTITVNRTGTGEYRVSLPGLGGYNGSVQVMSMGSDKAVCNTGGWGTDPGDPQSVVVGCRALVGGAPIDTYFNLLYARDVGMTGFADPSAKAAYLYADEPTAASYLPSSSYRWSSSGHGPRVTRQAKGRYTVRLTGIAGAGGSAQVTLYNNTKFRCQVSSLPTTGSTQLVGVRCYGPAGHAVDSIFDFAFTR
ncbi:MAG: hypothetical protein QOH61_212 [Chloroflexota bacterium]|nr:hypothetical protein [Chloroflexota bacterium]